jgi:hypothetical protein
MFIYQEIVSPGGPCTRISRAHFGKTDLFFSSISSSAAHKLIERPRFSLIVCFWGCILPLSAKDHAAIGLHMGSGGGDVLRIDGRVMRLQGCGAILVQRRERTRRLQLCALHAPAHARKVADWSLHCNPKNVIRPDEPW